MFKGLGTWLGLESPTTFTTSPDDKEKLTVEEQEEKVVEAQNEVNKQQPAEEPEENQENSDQGKGLGGEKQLFSTYYRCFCQMT